ncbi:MAG: ABC transporter ATP-binding protein [Prevotella sp.]|nr:ABC transporter ATP-binding protein [Prevotella sp.]
MSKRHGKLHDELEVLSLVWHNAKGQHLRLTTAMLLEVVIGLFPPSAIYLLQRAVGLKVTNIEALLTRENIILLLAIFLVYIVLTKLSRILTAYAMAEVEYGLRTAFVASLRRKSYSEINNHMGLQSSNGLTQETSMASSLIPMVYRSFIRATCTILAFCALLVLLSPQFFFVVLFLSAAVLLSVTFLRSRLKHIHQELFNRISTLYQLFAEWVNGYRIFRVYGTLDFAVNRMQEVFQTIRSTSRRLALIANCQSVVGEMLTYGVAAAIILLMPASDGVIDLGILISYPTAVLFIRGEAMMVIGGYQQLANTESSIRRLFKVIKGDDSKEPLPRQVGRVTCITFDNVSYAYNTDGADHKILSNANLALDKGRLHVITGPSGTGKTTTLNLLLGLLHQQQGHICIAEDNDAEDGPSGIALVEQEPFFFDGSLYDNLSMGRQTVDKADVMHYLEVLHLSHLFPTEESLTNPMELLARKLSSGEKQRLAFIRALIGHPAVLIVDEITSNIDADTSLLITQQLKEAARQILVVAVSHDPILISEADVVHTLHDKDFITTSQTKKT